MASHSLLVILVLLCYFLLLLLAANEADYHGKCPKSFGCGIFSEIQLPFTITTNPDCGLPMRGCDNDNPGGDKEILLDNSQTWYKIESIDQAWYHSISIHDPHFEILLSSPNCSALHYNASDPIIPSKSPLMSSAILNNITLFKCFPNSHGGEVPRNTFYVNCHDYDVYYVSEKGPPSFLSSADACSALQLPCGQLPSSTDPCAFLVSFLQIEVTVSEYCRGCYEREGQCLLHQHDHRCVDNEGHDLAPFPAPVHPPTEDKERDSKAMIIGISIGCSGATIIALLVIFMLYKRRHNSSGYQNQPSNIYSGHYSNTNTQSGTVYFGVPVFSYEELQEATNNFGQARQLGEGGFGTVYYGKLRDGREVAVKRLYEHNYRPVESFINEIKILTRLCHRNLVSLYGCTSRHSRELLLVYEYIPNGTLGGHLHGDQAKPGLLPWPVRLKIAIETASALAYLHASDIIHRDVKTSNILLDNNFCVKVADFGLSRLFPNDVTHVSTAPQGTPGYVDPEYRQCYQLTSKSDVYSFGVVLVELISSLPAVDLTRQRDEIKLANLAIKKIKKRALCELVDPSLDFQSDNKLKSMIISVGELAFQCLQEDKELRPSMGEVLEMLQRIEGGKDKPKNLEGLEFHGAGASHRNIHQSLPTTLNFDEVRLRMNLKPQRPHQTH